jgi:hypothetical protein
MRRWAISCGVRRVKRAPGRGAGRLGAGGVDGDGRRGAPLEVRDADDGVEGERNTGAERGGREMRS